MTRNDKYSLPGVVVNSSDFLLPEVRSPLLSIRLKTLTIRQLREMLHPQKLIEIMEGLAPFTWGILHTFCASPNASRKRKKAEEDEPMPVGEEDWEDDPNDDPDLESGEADPGPRLVAVGQEITLDSRGIRFFMLAFVRNRATNILPLILGLFFKISGTSSRVVLMLSNAGVCVSSRTVERLKARITEDAIQLAVQLITSGRLSVSKMYSISPKPILQNSLLFGVDGQMRAQQIFLPTSTDDEIVGKTFIALIAEMIVAFTPGNSGWTDRKNIAGAVADMMPKDRPLPSTASDARPFGLFDVNEGSKKGVERSTLPQRIWSAIWRIFVGDWLSSNNLRAARRDRTDDIDAMERLEYVQELSAPFHFALQASHMLMRTHYGHAVEDPGSLAAHKGLLNRKWDVSKPNYAAAKSLIRHSLIARILHCVMSVANENSWCCSAPLLCDMSLPRNMLMFPESDHRLHPVHSALRDGSITVNPLVELFHDFDPTNTRTAPPDERRERREDAMKIVSLDSRGFGARSPGCRKADINKHT
ncbi:hypothetical protein B0H14DRAFT_3590729 [Mycena olivaceomarginata]|nr:hypothetical protein B0H14DRAFT_3590729 [Mycena olivaceomarginata]